jgi:hypothetical protein
MDIQRHTIEILALVTWNIFMARIANDHILPQEVIIWLAGVGTGGFIGLFYINIINKGRK